MFINCYSIEKNKDLHSYQQAAVTGYNGSSFFITQTSCIEFLLLQIKNYLGEVFFGETSFPHDCKTQMQ